MNEKNKYTVEIFGDQYQLVSDEPQEHIVESAQRVNALMNEIAQKSGMTDIKKIAVLVALRTASELIHCEQTLHDVELQEKDLVQFIEQEVSEALGS